MVFDGALIHVAGAGKGSFNHRFAQTTRHPSHLEDQHPADFFPFTTTPGAIRSPAPRATCSSARALRVRCRGCSIRPPRPNTGRAPPPPAHRRRRQRGRAATSARAPVLPRRRPARQLALPRTFAFQNCGNPLDHRPPMRALLLALDAWASEDRAPPDSVYPKLGDAGVGRGLRRAFPKIPERSAERQPATAPPRPRPTLCNDGIADWQPPEFGPPYVTRAAARCRWQRSGRHPPAGSRGAARHLHWLEPARSGDRRPGQARPLVRLVRAVRADRGGAPGRRSPSFPRGALRLARGLSGPHRGGRS